MLRFKFKNGTDDSTLHTLNLKFPGWNGTGDVPLSTFISTFQPAAITTTTQWCNVCGQTTARGCDQLKGVPGPAALSKRDDSYIAPSVMNYTLPTIAHPSHATNDLFFDASFLAGVLVTMAVMASYFLGVKTGVWLSRKAARCSKEEETAIVLIARAAIGQKYARLD